MTFTHTKYELTAPGRPAFKITSETVKNGETLDTHSLKSNAEIVIARMSDETHPSYRAFMVGLTPSGLDMYAIEEKPGRLGSSTYGKKVKVNNPL